MHTNGRITSFDLQFRPRTGVKRAIASLLKVVPKDASHGPVRKLDTCAALEVRSSRLQRELGSSDAVVFFASGSDGSYYTPRAVTDAEIISGETVPSSC
jgi:hypothetical protein